MKARYKCFLYFISLIFSSHALSAWDGSVAGTINRIEVTEGNNYGFRVSLDGDPKLCGNEYSWAYVNESDSNYSTYVSALIAAKAAKQNVRLFTRRKDGADDGYCHIGFVYIL